MKEMPPEPKVVDKIERRIVEEETWRKEGGLAPQSVVDSLGDGILEKAYEFYPPFREEHIGHIKEGYTNARFAAAHAALAILYIHKRVNQWPVSLESHCKGPFVDIVSTLYEARFSSEKPLYDPLGYITFLAQDVIKDLKKVEWIEYQDTHGGDEYTPRGSYILTDKGMNVAESILNYKPGNNYGDLWTPFRELA